MRGITLVLVLAVWAAGGLASASGSEVPPVSRHLLVRVAPAYPELARRMHVSGDVLLTVAVNPDGSVGEVRVQSGHALLRQAAQDAVRHWRFAPGPATNLAVAVSFNVQQN